MAGISEWQAPLLPLFWKHSYFLHNSSVIWCSALIVCPIDFLVLINILYLRPIRFLNCKNPSKLQFCFTVDIWQDRIKYFLCWNLFLLDRQFYRLIQKLCFELQSLSIEWAFWVPCRREGGDGCFRLYENPLSWIRPSLYHTHIKSS